jgi:hypothetical protein
MEIGSMLPLGIAIDSGAEDPESRIQNPDPCRLDKNRKMQLYKSKFNSET